MRVARLVLKIVGAALALVRGKCCHECDDYDDEVLYE